MTSTRASAPPHPIYPILVLLCASTLWGLTWIPLKHFAAHGLHGVTVALVAHGSVCALAIPWLARHRQELRGQLTALLLLAGFGGVSNLSFVTAVASGDVVRVMVLFYLLPAWGVIGGRVVLGERIDGRRGFSVVCALGGARLVLGGFHVFASPPTLIDGLAVLAGMMLAFQNIAFRKFDELGISIKIAVVFVGCFACAAVLSALGVAPIPAKVPPVIWTEVVAFGLVWLLLASIGTLWGVAHMEAGRSSILIIMELVTAVVSAALLSSRSLSLLEWLGGGLIILAALLEAWRPGESGAK